MISRNTKNSAQKIKPVLNHKTACLTADELDKLFCFIKRAITMGPKVKHTISEQANKLKLDKFLTHYAELKEPIKTEKAAEFLKIMLSSKCQNLLENVMCERYKEFLKFALESQIPTTAGELTEPELVLLANQLTLIMGPYINAKNKKSMDFFIELYKEIIEAKFSKDTRDKIYFIAVQNLQELGTTRNLVSRLNSGWKILDKSESIKILFIGKARNKKRKRPAQSQPNESEAKSDNEEQHAGALAPTLTACAFSAVSIGPVSVPAMIIDAPLQDLVPPQLTSYYLTPLLSLNEQYIICNKALDNIWLVVTNSIISQAELAQAIRAIKAVYDMLLRDVFFPASQLYSRLRKESITAPGSRFFPCMLAPHNAEISYLTSARNIKPTRVFNSETLATLNSYYKQCSAALANMKLIVVNQRLYEPQPKLRNAILAIGSGHDILQRGIASLLVNKSTAIVSNVSQFSGAMFPRQSPTFSSGVETQFQSSVPSRLFTSNGYTSRT